MRPDYDCVVVGAGLIGAAQALALRRFGLDVLVVDARPPLTQAPGGDVRGLALAPSSRRVLETLDLWPALAEHVTRIQHIHVSDQGHFGVTRLSAADIDLDALGYVCPADHLLHTLESALRAQCETRWQTEVDRIDTTSEAVWVRLRGVAGTTEISARLVVGADGIRSQVREAIGVLTQTRDYRQSAIVANLTVERPVPETAYERFTRDGPLALLPIERGRHVAVRCCANTAVNGLIALSDARFLAELEAGFGHRFGEFSELGKRNCHPLILARADRIVGQRVALVGAAANSIHPNGAQGLNLGLRDVAALANCVDRAFLAGADPGGDAVLDDFARARRADHRAVIRLSDTLAQLFSSKLPPLALVRNAAMLALDITPPAKRWFMRRATGLFAEAMSTRGWAEQ